MIGEKLGPYEILEQVGKGGMATVYRARQSTVERDVAIKTLRSNIADDADAILRFQREARLIARLEHPHILPVYDFDGAFNPPYIVMRYLNAGTLKEVMTQGLLPHSEVNFLLRQVGSALDYAHRMGIIHRDVKPSNILIDQEGNAFVTDFGIARMTGAEYAAGEQITESGAIIGTPDYMSPEQAGGEENIDHRTDIYAFGVVVFEMLTGQLPFRASNALAVLAMHAREPVPSACALNKGLDAEVDRVMKRVLAKKPGNRYQSAAEFAEAITTVLGGAVAGIPRQLREAARTTKLLAGQQNSSDSQVTPPEQNKSVTALHCNATEYAEIIAEEQGAEISQRAIDELWEEAVAIIEQRSGTVITRGDNALLALWGTESVYEDDAEQAIRAALDIQGVLRKQIATVLPDEENDAPLPLNIGIHTGLALLKLSDDRSSLNVSGAAISLTNRLAQQAYGTVLLTHDTYLLVQGIFYVEADAPLKMRGKRENLNIYRVKGAKPRAFRMVARGIEGIETRLIGRDAELKILENAFLDVMEESETQSITIFGEAGYGKSRLLYEFSARAELHPDLFRIFRARASGGMINRPYALIRDLISYRFDIRDNDSLETLTQKLEEGVASFLPGQSNDEMAHFIGFICGFDMSESPYIKPLKGDPQQLDLLGRRKFLQLLMTIAREDRPIVMELEDIHYADDASLNLINELLNEDDSMALMLVSTARNSLRERRPDWGGGLAFHNTIELNALDRRSSRTLVSEILKKVDHIPAKFRDLIIERSRGNPYFVEEIIKILIDDKVIVKSTDDHWHIEESRLNNLRLPPTLTGILQARYDTLLQPEKILLQRASVIGRVFHDSALKALDAGSETRVDELEAVLARLLEEGFIERRETTAIDGSSEYIFSGIMMQEMIYAALLRRHKVRYHRLTAEWLIQEVGERSEEYYPIIAHHYEAADEPVKASGYLQLAGKAANNKGIQNEAVMYFRRSVQLLPADDPDRMYREIRLGRALQHQGHYDEAKTILEKLLPVVRESEDAGQLARLVRALGRIYTDQGHLEEAMAIVNEALDLTARDNDLRQSVLLKRRKAEILLQQGEYSEAKSLLENILKEAKQLDEPVVTSMTLNLLAVVEAVKGNPRKALVRFQQVADSARSIGHRNITSMSLGNVAEVYIVQRRWREAKKPVEESLTIAVEIGNLQFQSLNLMRLGLVKLMLDEPGVSAALFEGLSIARNQQIVQHEREALVTRARMLMMRNRVEEALVLLGTVNAHPRINDETRQQIQRLLDDHPMNERIVEAGMAKGADCDFDETIDAVLEELKQEMGEM